VTHTTTATATTSSAAPTTTISFGPRTDVQQTNKFG
jgi:hypothetical protein